MTIDIDMLAAYRRLIPAKLRRKAHPVLWSIYCAATGLDLKDVPPKEAEKVLLRSANLKYKEWRLNDAVAEVDVLLRESPDHRGALHLKADILARLGNVRDATKLTKKLLRSRPIDLRAVNRLKAMGVPYVFSESHPSRMTMGKGSNLQNILDGAKYLNDGGFSDAAISLAKRGLQLPPPPDKKLARNFRTALLAEIAHALEIKNNHSAAVRVYRKMDHRTRAFDKMASRYALCLLELDRPEEAEEILREAGAFPDGPIPYNAALIHTLYRMGRIFDAHRTYRARASSRAISEYFNAGAEDPREIDLKGGAYANKRCLFISEGGPGDEIRFSSTYNELASLVGDASITCDPRLTTLFQRSFPQIEFVPVQRYRQEILTTRVDSRSKLKDFRLYPSVSDSAIERASDCDFTCAVLDTLADTRPSRPSFERLTHLVPDPDLKATWLPRMARNRPQIGISWRSMLMSKERNKHYLLAPDIARIGTLVDADFWLLQPKTEVSEVELLRSALNLRVPDIDLKDDFEGQAALISCLDAVVAPLTTTAELAGMSGTRTVIFGRTQQVTWRKNEDGSDVWYTNARFVTGSPLHDVDSLVANIASELSDIIGGRN